MNPIPSTMQAMVTTAYGPPEVLQPATLPVPALRKGELLIRVEASAVNSADWRLRKADPWLVRLFFGLFRPRIPVYGGVFSGTVAAVGEGVSEYPVGSQVFGSAGMRFGAYAEYLVVPQAGVLTTAPPGIALREAAALVFGSLTAAHYLRAAVVGSGTSLLVVGASGSVGIAAVQLASESGARVTGVCSAGSANLVRSAGAAETLDYQDPGYEKQSGQYDVVMDTVGHAHWKSGLRLLRKGGILVLVNPGTWNIIWLPMIGGRYGVWICAGVAEERREDLERVRDLVGSGSIRPVIDREYPLAQLAEAHRYVEAGHKKGNVLIRVRQE